MKVDTIVTKNVQTIDANTSLIEAQDIFRKHHIRHLPVTNNGKLAGILSLTDIQRISFGDTFGTDESAADSTIYESLTVGQIMKANPKTIGSDQTIKEVVDIFTSEEFHALPVVDNDKLTGIVTTTDLIKLLAQEV